jgi:hypothetical protein
VQRLPAEGERTEEGRSGLPPLCVMGLGSLAKLTPEAVWWTDAIGAGRGVG